MFDIARLFHTAQNVQDPDRDGAPVKDESAVKIIAMTQDAGVWEALRHIADHFNWILFWAANLDQALPLIERYSASILIYDRDMTGCDWRTALRRLRSHRTGPCILLASRVSDPYLWKEVVRNGGFDVITKPFDPERVSRAIRCASTRDWPSRAISG